MAKQKPGVTQQREQRFVRIGEISFTSRRKMMSTIERDHRARPSSATIMRDHAHGDAVVLVSKGAPDVLSGCCTHVRVGLQTLALDPARCQQILQEVDTLSDAALAKATDAIREAHRAGIRVVVVTSDHPRTAARIAFDLGIAGTGTSASTGLERDALDYTALTQAVRTTSVFCARVAPAHKLGIVAALQVTSALRCKP